MKPFLLFVLVLPLAAMLSCQKQIGWSVDAVTGEIIDDTAYRLPGADTFRLSRQVGISGSTQVETILTYSANKEVLTEQHQGVRNGTAVNIFRRYQRDTLGRIAMIAEKQAGADTAFTYVFYDDDRSKQYWYVLKVTASAKDSSVFTYDGNNHIAIEKIFRRSGNAYKPFARNEYTWQHDNVTGATTYADSANTGILVLKSNCTMQYDNRFNPLYLHHVAPLTGQLEAFSKNNLMHLDMHTKDVATGNFSVTIRYQYDAFRKPVSSVAVYQPGNLVTQYAYMY